MVRTILGWMLIGLSSAVHAEIVESEWTPSAPVDNDAELAIVGGKMHAFAPVITSFGFERRAWTRIQPTLATDWAVVADVHVDNLQLPVDPLQFVKIGIELGRPGANSGLATLSLSLTPGAPEPFVRVVQAGYMLGPFGGRSDVGPLSATDAVLRLSYTAADRSMRTYFKPQGGGFLPINTYSTDPWNVPANEALEIRIFTEPWFVELVQGQAYVADVRVVPEPALAANRSVRQVAPCDPSGDRGSARNAEARSMRLAGFLFVLALGFSTVNADDWQPLFNGKDLAGWQANNDPESFTVEDGVLRVQASGNTSAHLFFVDGRKDGFERYKDFDLQATVKAERNSNGGIFIHTDMTTRDAQKHLAKGYEVQLNSSSREKRKTGSLYAVVDLDESPVDETKWFTIRVVVRGKRITIALDDKEIVDYTEPPDVVRPKERAGRLFSADGGAIALQAHDAKSVWYFKDIRVKRLP